MDIVGSKVVVLVLLGALKISAGLLPIILTKYLAKRRKLKCLDKFIGLVLCIGGGILLSTVFIHMIKEVRETLDAAMKKGIFKDKDLEYPFAELLICMGFLLIFLIESIVHKFFGGHGHGHGTPINKTKPVEFEVGGSVPAGLDNQAFAEDLPQSTSTPSTLKRIVSGDNSDSRPQTPKLPFAAGKIKGTGKNVYNVSSATLTSYASFDAESMSMSTPTTAKGNFVGSTNSLQSDNSIAREKSFLSSVRGFLIVLALSIHSLFEGMAIGLEETDSGVWKLFAAVIVHGVAIVFCIGTEMISSGLKKKTILIYMLVLGVNSPVGVLIGLIVTLQIENPSGGHLLAIGVLQGLAGGTLLYITFFEVLSREKLTKYNMTGLTGILAIAFGFTLMAVMEGAGGHNHSHGGGGSLDHADHSGHNHGGVKQLWQGEEDEPRFHLDNNPFKNSDQHFHPKHGYDDLSNEDHEQHNHDDHFHEHKDNDGHDHEQHDHDDHNHEQHDHEYHDHEQHDHDDHDHEQHDHDDHDHRHQDVDHSDGDHDHNHDELENDHDHDHDHQHQDDHARERHENDHYVENHDHQHDHGNAADYHNELEHIHGDDVHEHEGHNHDEHKDYANEHNHNDTALDVRSKAVKKPQERGRSLSDHDHQHGNQNHEHDHVEEAHIHDVHNDLHHEENHVHHGIALNGHDPTHDNKTVYHEHDVHKDHQDNNDHDDHDLEENAHENHTEMHHEHDSNKNHAERHEDLVHDNHTETHHVHDIFKDSHHAHAHDTDSDHHLESHNDHDNITDSDHDHVHDHADSTDSHNEHDHGNLSDIGNFHGPDNRRESHSDHDPNDHIEDHDEHAHGHNHKVMPKIMAESAVDYEDHSDHEGHIEGSHQEGLDHDLHLKHIQEEMGHDHEHQNNKEEISHDHDHQNSQEEMDHDHDHQNSREEMGHEHDHRHSQEEMDQYHDHQISQEELVHEDGHVHNHGEGRDEHAGDNVDGSEHNHDDHEHSEPIQIAEKSANVEHINGTNKNSGFLANVADFLG